MSLFLRNFFVFLFLMFFLQNSVFAVVDMKNANYSESWTDVKLDGIGYDLKVVRAYNSRSLMNGIFGFGWCSEFESRIRVTAEGGLEVTECGSGLEITFHRKGFNKKSVEETIGKILKEVRRRNKTLKPKYLSQLKKDLEYDNALRAEFVKQLNLKGKIQKGAIYYADGRKDDSISIKGQNYIRNLPDGSFQIFNRKDGFLKAWHDKNQNFIKISYQAKGKQKRISHVLDNNGRKLSFLFKGNKVSEIRGPKNISVRYWHKEEDLVKFRSPDKTEYYKYDELHNLTDIISKRKKGKNSNRTEEISKKILYNKDKDWVTGFIDSKGCEEKYRYKSNPKNPLNHYWSYVVKRCKNKILNKSVYEFVHKIHPQKGRYLHRAKSDRNGFVIDTTYHPIFRKPLIQIVNNHKMQYSYYKSGLLEKKTSPYYVSRFAYKNACNKVSSVKINYNMVALNRKLAESKRNSKRSQKQQIRNRTKTITTNLFYKSPRCNLVRAQNSRGQKVNIAHDHKGRVSFLKDQAERSVHIKYHDSFEDKPKIIHRPGVGSIQIKYKSNGEIKNIESKDGVTVASQVMNVFSNLMDVINPVASQVTL